MNTTGGSVRRACVRACICGVAGLLPGAAWAQNGAPPPTRVVAEAVRRETVAQWRDVTGELRAARRALLATEEAGLLAAAPFREGDMVREGEEVARLDARRAELALARAQAQAQSREAIVAQRRAVLDRARRELEDKERLYNEVSAARREVDDARTAVEEASARLLEAQADHAFAMAELRLAQVRLEDMTVRAPFDGVVVQRRAEQGEWLGEGDAVIELMDTTSVEAWLHVPESSVELLLSPGATVWVEVPSRGSRVEAPVTRVIPDADPLSRLFPVRVVIQNADGSLRPGARVTGKVPTGERAPTLLVHKDGIRRDDAGEFVYAALGGVATPVRVTTLFAVGDWVAVRSGALEAGVPVIVEGNERLFPGQPVEATMRATGEGRDGGGADAGASGAAGGGPAPAEGAR